MSNENTEKKFTVEIDGNTYSYKDGVVYKKHGKSEKVVGNIDKINQVKAALGINS